MKKLYLFIILFLRFYAHYGQEPMQESYVSKTYINVDDEWSVINFSSMVDVSSNREGQLKITNAEFLTEFSGGKVKMLDETAYNSAGLISPVLVKSKTEKNGLVDLTYEGKLIYKTAVGVYEPSVKIIFIVNNADIIGLKIYNRENSKEYAFDLTLKD